MSTEPATSARSELPHVVILGGGPAGVSAAYRLTATGRARVTVLEQRSAVGGTAGSFEIDGHWVDYGSHRLHTGASPDLLNDLRSLLGPDLRLRRRRGRILLLGRALHFPLQPLDLMQHLPWTFSLGVARDLGARILGRLVPGRQTPEATFATVLEAGLGATICTAFYFPYARKIWATDPGELSAALARRRVSASSPLRMVKKLLDALPGVGSSTSQQFLYPRRGYGQISTAFADAAVRNGASIRLEATVRTIDLSDPNRALVTFDHLNKTETTTADLVWSSIPLTALVRAITPTAPAAVSDACRQLQFRGMILIYLVLDRAQYGSYDSYYFPGSSTPIARCSEPKNFSGEGPASSTVLCAELPCDPEDEVWSASDETLGLVVADAMSSAGLPTPTPVRTVTTRRLTHAYPVYRRGFDDHLEVITSWLERLPRLLTFGRQGLFVHDNADHAIGMAYAASECLRPNGTFDDLLWAHHLKTFEQQVVAD